jgi:hypothetical protein
MKTNFYLVAENSSNCVPIFLFFYNRIVILKNAVDPKKLHVLFIFNIFSQLIIKYLEESMEVYEVVTN